MKDIIIIGGGLAGLISAIRLGRAGLKVCLIEKKVYPFHRVCGEYISNEVTPFLQSLRLFPTEKNPSSITRLLLSADNGKMVTLPLQQGGFGISRYTFDHFLFQQAQISDVEIMEQTQVENVEFDGQTHWLTTAKGKCLQAPIVIGAFGKRSVLDKKIGRAFFDAHTDFIGVKYHIRTNLPEDTIALHNFPGGYCGICKIEDDLFNLCYLGSKKDLKKWGNIEAMEENVLNKNPFLKNVFQNSDFVYEKPMVINQISFLPKPCIEDHMLMCGDAAGLITPLCGNGMAMAIHGAKVLTDLILTYYKPSWFNRTLLEEKYQAAWQQNFSSRLFIGRNLQPLMIRKHLSRITVNLAGFFPTLASSLIKQTHGKPF